MLFFIDRPAAAVPVAATTAAATIESNKKSKSNDDEAVRSRERRLKAKLEAFESNQTVAVSEAVAVTTHKLSTANQNKRTPTATSSRT